MSFFPPPKKKRYFFPKNSYICNNQMLSREKRCISAVAYPVYFKTGYLVMY